MIKNIFLQKCYFLFLILSICSTYFFASASEYNEIQKLDQAIMALYTEDTTSEIPRGPIDRRQSIAIGKLMQFYSTYPSEVADLITKYALLNTLKEGARYGIYLFLPSIREFSVFDYQILAALHGQSLDLAPTLGHMPTSALAIEQTLRLLNTQSPEGQWAQAKLKVEAIRKSLEEPCPSLLVD